MPTPTPEHLREIEAQYDRELAELRARYLGKDGVVSGIMRQLAALPAEDRRVVGAAINSTVAHIHNTRPAGWL